VEVTDADRGLVTPSQALSTDEHGAAWFSSPHCRLTGDRIRVQQGIT
jgi:hypothetical protein